MVSRAVILAIGSINHRSMLTYNRTHAMLPALGKPLVVRIMDRLYRVGIRHFTVVVGDNEGTVASYLNTQWKPDTKIDFLFQSQLTSMKRTLADIARNHKEAFILCSYNSFTHTSFAENLLKNYVNSPTDLVLTGSTTTLSKAKHHYYAIMDGQRIKSVSQSPSSNAPYFILTNFAICGESFVEFVANPENTKTGQFNSQFMDIVAQYVQSDNQASIMETSWVLQVEADRDLLTLNKHLLDEGQDAHILSEIPYTVQITPPVRIDPQVNLGQGAKIGPHVYLERGCSVGHDTTLRNTIILERASVPAKKTAYDTVISTRGPIP